MRDKSRTAVVEQLARAPALLDPERLTSGTGSLLRDGLSLRGPVGFPITRGSPIPPSPTTPFATASRRPTSRCAPRWTPRWSKPTCVEKQGAAAVFANVVTSSSLAPTNVLLGNPATLKRALESGDASRALGLRNYLH
jgi:polyhydroxyalkanoate synthase subunit PhaC